MSKKSVLLVGFLGSLFFILFLYATKVGLCNLINSSCLETFDSFAENITISLPLFLLSLITFKMRSEVFSAWFKFTRIWVPLSIFLVLISPEYSHGLIPLDKGTVSLAFSALFLVISLFIIFIKFFSKQSNKK